jgi:hypothetical protein
MQNNMDAISEQELRSMARNFNTLFQQGDENTQNGFDRFVISVQDL